MSEEFLTVKMIAEKLKRDESYIYQMRRRGFVMAGGRSTMSEVLNWLRDHEPPWRKIIKK